MEETEKSREYSLIGFWLHILSSLQPRHFYTVHMWQSWVEIEQYFAAYFDRITMFEALQHSASITGGPHMHWVNS